MSVVAILLGSFRVKSCHDCERLGYMFASRNVFILMCQLTIKTLVQRYLSDSSD